MRDFVGWIKYGKMANVKFLERWIKIRAYPYGYQAGYLVMFYA